MILACHAHFFILFEYAIRLEMKDAFFGCHESIFTPEPIPRGTQAVSGCLEGLGGT